MMYNHPLSAKSFWTDLVLEPLRQIAQRHAQR